MQPLRHVLPLFALSFLANSSSAADNPEPCFIKNQTVYTWPANRERLKLGVREQVNLSAPEKADWKITAGGGNLSFAVGQSTQFTAPTSPGTTTITATIRNRACTITFTSIIPEGVTMTAEAPFYHIFGIPSAGFTGRNIVLSPSDVSFRPIRVREELVGSGNGSGVFTTLNGQPHPQGNAYGVNEGNIVNSGGDQVFSRGDAPPVNGSYAGEYNLSIPWTYSAGGNFQFMFDVLHHSLSDNAGRTVTDKAQAQKTFNRNDPAQSF